MPASPPERSTHADKLLDEHIEVFAGAVFHAPLRCAENFRAVIASRLVC